MLRTRPCISPLLDHIPITFFLNIWNHNLCTKMSKDLKGLTVGSLFFSFLHLHANVYLSLCSVKKKTFSHLLLAWCSTSNGCFQPQKRSFPVVDAFRSLWHHSTTRCRNCSSTMQTWVQWDHCSMSDVFFQLFSFPIKYSLGFCLSRLPYR